MKTEHLRSPQENSDDTKTPSKKTLKNGNMVMINVGVGLENYFWIGEGGKRERTRERKREREGETNRRTPHFVDCFHNPILVLSSDDIDSHGVED